MVVSFVNTALSKLCLMRQRYVSIVKHSYKLLTILIVCQYLMLIETMRENIEALEQVISSFGPFIESMRAVVPRLFALSNHDILSLRSATCSSSGSIYRPYLWILQTSMSQVLVRRRVLIHEADNNIRSDRIPDEAIADQIQSYINKSASVVFECRFHYHEH